MLIVSLIGMYFDSVVFVKASSLLFKLALDIQSKEVRFSSFLSGGFTTMAVINPPESKLAKRTSVQWSISI